MGQKKKKKKPLPRTTVQGNLESTLETAGHHNKMLLVFSSDLLYVCFLSCGHTESFQKTHFGRGGGGQMALMAREFV